jgi:hypothetical protein
MTAGVRVAAFAALLAVVFAAAALAGRAVGPGSEAQDAAPRDHAGAASHEQALGAMHEHAGAAMRSDAPAGLSLAQDGLRLVATGTTTLRPGRLERFAFRIVDARGATVRAFDTEQDRRMHLIVVRRDLTAYQHLHPAEARDGAWRTPLHVPAGGAYRAFADFQTGGRRHTLGVDLLAAGAFAPRPLPPPATAARTDGYDVALHEHGADELSFTVRRRGKPVADLQPYLGARGHLVVLRAGDLAYEHVHPLPGAGAPGEIAFRSMAPVPGSYRLFLQFRHGGRVHTAAFTRAVSS